MDTKVDLYKSLVRYLAIKPLPENDNLCQVKAQSVVKEENKDDISFIAQHGYFEDILDTVEQRIGNLKPENGVLYIYIKGDDSRKRIERNLLNIIMYVNKVYIVGKAEDWSFNDPRIEFIGIEDRFVDNHQRFLIFNSASYNVALVSRRGECVNPEDKAQIEAALTNKKEAVSFLSQTLAPLFYKSQI